MARIAAELYRLVDSQAQQVSALRLCCCCLGWVQAALRLLSWPSFTSRLRCQCSCTSVLLPSCTLSITFLTSCSSPCKAQWQALLTMQAMPGLCKLSQSNASTVILLVPLLCVSTAALICCGCLKKLSTMLYIPCRYAGTCCSRVQGSYMKVTELTPSRLLCLGCKLLMLQPSDRSGHFSSCSQALAKHMLRHQLHIPDPRGEHLHNGYVMLMLILLC